MLDLNGGCTGIQVWCAGLWRQGTQSACLLPVDERGGELVEPHGPVLVEVHPLYQMVHLADKISVRDLRVGLSGGPNFVHAGWQKRHII